MVLFRAPIEHSGLKLVSQATPATMIPRNLDRKRFSGFSVVKTYQRQMGQVRST